MKKSAQACRFAVIGGSGLYDLEGIADVSEHRIRTPFGDPSGAVVLGTIAGVRCAFLPRHGRGHVLLPSEVNSRANIWALKSLGVQRILAMTAVGSLREELAPRHFVFPDQLVDETRGRRQTFFGEGVVAHVAFAHPFCAEVSDLLHAEAGKLGLTVHRGGTYICMEGPAFSTKAESDMHRRLGYSIIGMTALGEAKLAREAEICYSTVAMVTDFDCWKEEDEVSAGKVVAHMIANVANARRLIAAALPRLAAAERRCGCAHALRGAIFTQPKAMDPKTVRRLELLIGKYVSQEVTP
ncbi:MAG TPA: S-methyl-5'-thioadenosine phosphorylase [Elusimicrobia bacterium]|nr:S-methyl-5'-thioadenosine phosphorylase [Elusimicrobiota bacterium]